MASNESKTVKSLSSYPVQIKLKNIVAVLLFVVYTTINVSAVKGAYEVRIQEIENTLIRLTDIVERQDERMDTLEANIKDLEQKSHISELEYTEIKTKLLNIESVLMEIKERINN